MANMPQREGANKLDWQTVVEAAMRTAVRSAIERVVEEELAAALGPRYARAEGRAGYRHGSKGRQLTTPAGPVVLTVPRGRLHHADGRTTEWQSALTPLCAAHAPGQRRGTTGVSQRGQLAPDPGGAHAAAGGESLGQEHDQPDRAGAQGGGGGLAATVLGGAGSGLPVPRWLPP
jgi:hypothetical protein